MVTINSEQQKPLVWLAGSIQTPPLSTAARIEAGLLLRKLQLGERLGLPHSRPMPSIGKRCHELRVSDTNVVWRIVYRTDNDAIVIAAIWAKKTEQTPLQMLNVCVKRFKQYDRDADQEGRFHG